jgi:3-(3-hydroxy-phenyl)propionate hydroxylase
VLHFDDLAGLGFRLVAVAAVFDEIGDHDARWFTDIGGAFVVVDDDGPVRDHAGQYAAWFERHGVIAVLQRPDARIFGTATDGREVGALISKLREAMSDRRRETVTTSAGPTGRGRGSSSA